MPHPPAPSPADRQLDAFGKLYRALLHGHVMMAMTDTTQPVAERVVRVADMMVSLFEKAIAVKLSPEHSELRALENALADELAAIVSNYHTQALVGDGPAVVTDVVPMEMVVNVINVLREGTFPRSSKLHHEPIDWGTFRNDRRTNERAGGPPETRIIERNGHRWQQRSDAVDYQCTHCKMVVVDPEMYDLECSRNVEVKRQRDRAIATVLDDIIEKTGGMDSDGNRVIAMAPIEDLATRLRAGTWP